MKFRNHILVLVVLLLTMAALPVFADDKANLTTSDSGQAFQTLERIETIVFGAPQGGDLVNRLANAEKEVFGRELPGSLTERQTAMLDFLEKGTTTQPSLLFKLAVTEWGVSREVHPSWAMSRRVDTLEAVLDGSVQGGPLAARIEKLITKLLPEGVLSTPAALPKITVVKCALAQTLTVRSVKVNDKVVLTLAEEIIVGGSLFAPRGSRVFAHITKVKPPRSFGRASEIDMAFDALEVLGPSSVAVGVGQAAKKAMELDSAAIGAAGASFAGAVLLGPVGLAGGFLVRGSDKQLKQGTLFYVETTDDANVQSYKVPSQISSLVTSGDASSPQGSQPLNGQPVVQ